MNLNGQILSGIPGVPTIYYGANGPGLDGEGRITQVTASSGTNPVTGVTYVNSNGTGQPVGALTQVVFGSTSGPGDSDNFSYDPNTGRMNKYTFTVNGQSVIGNPSWNANGTLQGLNITQDPFNAGNVQNCSDLYDDFMRVASTTCMNGSATVWSQTFAYDQFGNITKSGSLSWACAICYDLTTNHYNTNLSSAISYDADGNLTADTFHTYQWDAEGHMVGNDSSTFTYDAAGHMAEASWGDQYLYDTNDALLAGSHAQASAYFAHMPLPGGAIAGYANGSLVEYKHADWLHSARLSSSPAHAINYDLAFAPYGEPYTSSHVGNIFAGMEQIVASDEYDTLAREYNTTQGRWVSPDPMRGTGNKYVYADNNPLSKVDLYGLFTTAAPPMDPNFAAWFDSEMNQADPLLESHPSWSGQTGAGAFGVSEAAYLADVDAAFHPKSYDVEVETAPVLARKVAEESQAQGQPEQEAQNQSQPVLIAQNQDPNQSQSSSSSSSSSGRVNSPAQGQQPDTTVTIPSNKPGETTERTYGPDGRAVKDVDSGHAHDPEPHAHDWDWSKTPPRQPRRDLTPDEAAGKKSTILEWAGDHKGALITGGVILGIGATILTGGAAAPALAFVF